MKPMKIRLLSPELHESDIHDGAESTDFVVRDLDHDEFGGVDNSVRAHQCFFMNAPTVT